MSELGLGEGPRECPFCGSRSVTTYRPNGLGAVAVCCDAAHGGCGAHAFWCGSKRRHLAVRAWNRRSERTCRYLPDEPATWWDEDDVEHEEPGLAVREWGVNGVCSECGNVMLGTDDGWFDFEPREHGWAMVPRFRYCPQCGARVLVEEE